MRRGLLVVRRPSSDSWLASVLVRPGERQSVIIVAIVTVTVIVIAY
jgi:hypothetical protein